MNFLKAHDLAKRLSDQLIKIVKIEVIKLKLHLTKLNKIKLTCDKNYRHRFPIK